MKREFYTRLQGVVESISSFKIYGSTDAVLEGIALIPLAVSYSRDLSEGLKAVDLAVNTLVGARPTSVMMANYIRRMLVRLKSAVGKARSTKEVASYLEEEYRRIRGEVGEALETIAAIGSRRIKDGEVVFTNSYSRTVFEVLKRAKEEGREFSVYLTESRPGLEGRYMAQELDKLGISVTLFVDSASRYFMKDVDKVFVGAEAIAANGAVVNKVGTSLIALAAHEARVNVFVAAFSMKFSPETLFGELVKIVARPAEELMPEALRELGDLPKVDIPMFDVTPPEYIDAIITERGLLAPEAVILLVKEIYGWPPRLVNVGELLGQIMREVRSRA